MPPHLGHVFLCGATCRLSRGGVCWGLVPDQVSIHVCLVISIELCIYPVTGALRTAFVITITVYWEQ